MIRGGVCSEKYLLARKGVAAIIFYKSKKRNDFLILKRKKNWKGWEFVKGGRKRGESEINALKREVKEETGLRDFRAKKTSFFQEFQFSKKYMKDNREWGAEKNCIFLVEVFNKKIKLDRIEHSGFKWTSKREAIKLLTWKDSKENFIDAAKRL